MKDSFQEGDVVMFDRLREKFVAPSQSADTAHAIAAENCGAFDDKTQAGAFYSPTVAIKKSNGRFYAHFLKRFLDVTLVFASAPVTLPVVLLFAAALWFEGGSPFYRQARLGRNGKEFSILKLRTMGSRCRTEIALLP